MTEFEAMIDTKVLKHAITVLRRVNDEAVFEINENGLMCRLVDVANSQMAQVKLFGDAWDLNTYVGEPQKVGINLNKIGGFLNRATVKDTIHITGVEDRWYFTRGIHQRSTKLLDLEKIRKTPTRPELSHTVKVTLSGREFKEIIAEVADIGEVLQITARSGGISFDTYRVDEDTYHGKLDAGRLEMRMGVHEAQVLYSLDYLHYRIAVDMKAADEVTLRFADTMPCEIEYIRDGCEVSHTLAPRIESD